ncbi:SLC13 family permease [Trichothermofontia sichuanensis B231]|uniref:SLC13 family permease n=1 Tax=Trichothermofontia sichuanensis TaxID=3045816 RepID=UPI0022474572|nr:SLC13 family permease [Trichothermofontia sichuanensis]UZQ53854.1 SLC13 family permease [Trichothermofontia sichuanensis B231]
MELAQTWQSIGAVVIFAGVIFVLMAEWVHLTIAAFLGAMLLIFLNILTLTEAIDYIGQSYSTLALFFGVMVLVRAFEPTKIFEYLATKIVIWAGGQGRRLLLGIVGLTTLCTAFLPNATTVMLLAPLIPPIAQEIGVDFVPLLLLITFVANSGSLLTLVGDPVTFLVGDAINLSFTDYLIRLGGSGIVAIVTLIALLPWLFRRTWHKQLDNLDKLPHPQINHPRTLSMGIVIVTFVLVFFVIGEYLPVPIAPASVALMGAALALLLSHHSNIESVNQILSDVDWSTLIFFMSFFVLIGGLEKTGVIAQLSKLLAFGLDQNIILGSLALLFLIGFLSSVVPNIPLVVAMIPLLKQSIVNLGLAGPEILSPAFSGNLPSTVLPLFYAMMIGATLGGNGTLAGASANIVAAGISEQHDRRITFRRFLRYGIPVMVIQLITGSIYLFILILIKQG